MSYAVPTLIGVTSALLVLITVFVAIRFFVRSVLLRSIDWDDGKYVCSPFVVSESDFGIALVFISYCLAAIFLSAVLASEFDRLTSAFARAWADVAVTNVGFGSHVDVVSADHLRQFLKLQTVTALSYVWGFVTVKMSFAVLYLRLLPDITHRRLNQGLLILLLAEGVEECLVVIFKCNPVDKAWTPSKEGTCLDLRSFYYASVRISATEEMRRTNELILTQHSLVGPMLWSEVEVCALILCACVPSFKPFLRCFPSVSKALGLSSGGDSASPYHRDVSRTRHSVTLTSRSNKRKPSRGGIYESPDLEITVAATPSGPLSDHGSTEEILSHELGECSTTFVTGSLTGIATLRSRITLLLLNRPFTGQLRCINKVGPLVNRKPSLLFSHGIPLLVHLPVASELVLFLESEMYEHRAAKKKYSLVSKH
ncbi:hypothetical protein AUP68_04220 [Ilyonectria robusta]